MKDYCQMTQTQYRFSFVAPKELTLRNNKKDRRFISKRRIIDSIRKGVSKVVVEATEGTDKSNDFDYLLALTACPKTQSKVRIQSASAIPKWFILDMEVLDDKVSGVLILLIESAPINKPQMISQLITRAGAENQIDLTMLDVLENEFDFEETIEPVTYNIDSFLTGILAPANMRKDKLAIQELVQKTYPHSRDPEAVKILSKNVGKAIKRHLIENAQHHALDPGAIEDAMMFVNAHWIAYPVKGSKDKSDRSEALKVSIQIPIDLKGTWFSGSYRHKGMGLIEKSTSSNKPMKTGAVIL